MATIVPFGPQHPVLPEPLHLRLVLEDEIVKEALARNSAALILVHNHPSGVAEPSRADEALTQTLKSALSLVDVRVIDHLIVAGPTILSFAERGLI